jgi:hypothetical protein
MKINIVKGVFTDLAEGLNNKSAFSSFLDLDDKLEHVTNNYEPVKKNKGTSKESLNMDNKIRDDIKKRLVQCKQEYGRVIRSDEFQNLISRMVKMETEMMQARCILNMEIKLGITTREIKSGEKVDYVIGRSHFYRPGYVRSDITVYLGSTQDLGDDIEKMKKDTKFMGNVYEELRDVMIREMK